MVKKHTGALSGPFWRCYMMGFNRKYSTAAYHALSNFFEPAGSITVLTSLISPTFLFLLLWRPCFSMVLWKKINCNIGYSDALMEIGYFPVKHNWCGKYKRQWKLWGLMEALLILPYFGGGEDISKFYNLTITWTQCNSSKDQTIKQSNISQLHNF